MPRWEPNRGDRKSLAIAAAVAAHVCADPDACLVLARRNIAKMRTVASNAGALRWLDDREQVLDQGTDAIVAMLTERSQHGAAMRQMAPFSGVLGEEERQAVLDEFVQADRAAQGFVER